MNLKKYGTPVAFGLIGATSLMFIGSAAMMGFGLKQVMTAYSSSAAIPVIVPMIEKKTIPYDQARYKEILSVIAADVSVRAEATNDRLLISTATVADEPSWRRAVADVLSMDRNLKVARVCGSATNACTGNALLAEVVGSKQSYGIKN
jgi:hypothetical protein